MENNEFLFMELSKTLEVSVSALKDSSYISESAINRYHRYAELLVKKYAEGYYINDNGKRVNIDGDLIKEFDKLKAKKNTTICIFENKMDVHVSDYDLSIRFSGKIHNYIKLFFVCYQWGKHLHKSGRQSEGCKYLFDALKFVNMWSGAMVAHMLQDRYDEVIKNRINTAREGGKGRAKSYEPLKAKVVELLNEHVPEGRWKTKTAAIDALQNDITQFIEDKNIKISWHRAITDWSRNDNVIKATFDKVVKKK